MDIESYGKGQCCRCRPQYCPRYLENEEKGRSKRNTTALLPQYYCYHNVCEYSENIDVLLHVAGAQPRAAPAAPKAPCKEVSR